MAVSFPSEKSPAPLDGRPQHPTPYYDYLGQVQSTIEESNHRELALGTRGRSGDQGDLWQAVYSPVGANGYPKPIWYKVTGTIDRSVAGYWKEHWHLSDILTRDWKTLGPKVRGKLNIYAGEADNYFLNDAVYPGGRLPQDRHRSAGRRPGGPDVHPAHHGPDPAKSSAGCGHPELEILSL